MSTTNEQKSLAEIAWQSAKDVSDNHFLRARTYAESHENVIAQCKAAAAAVEAEVIRRHKLQPPPNAALLEAADKYAKNVRHAEHCAKTVLGYTSECTCGNDKLTLAIQAARNAPVATGTEQISDYAKLEIIRLFWGPCTQSNVDRMTYSEMFSEAQEMGAPPQPVPPGLVDLLKDCKGEILNLKQKIANGEKEGAEGYQRRAVLDGKLKNAIDAAEWEAHETSLYRPAYEDWKSLSTALDEICPGWHPHDHGSELVCAIAVIRRLKSDLDAHQTELRAAQKERSEILEDAGRKLANLEKQLSAASAEIFETAVRKPEKADAEGALLLGWSTKSNWWIEDNEAAIGCNPMFYPFWCRVVLPPAPEPSKAAWFEAWGRYEAGPNAGDELPPEQVTPARTAFLAALHAAKANPAILDSLPAQNG